MGWVSEVGGGVGGKGGGVVGEWLVCRNMGGSEWMGVRALWWSRVCGLKGVGAVRGSKCGRSVPGGTVVVEGAGSVMMIFPNRRVR